MAFRRSVYDQDTRNTGYSSVHSLDAYVGEYQMMYTPGNSPPAQKRKPYNRFQSTRRHTGEIIIPPAVPDTSQILPDRGSLKDIHVHYNIPADEKQIVASLRNLQSQLDEAMVRIERLELERETAISERDQARKERDYLQRQLREDRASSKKVNSARRHNQHDEVEEDLFDLSRIEDSPPVESPKKSTLRSAASKRVSIGEKTAPKTTTENDARVLSPRLAERVEEMSPQAERRSVNRNISITKDRRSSKKVTLQDTEQSIIEDVTAASNTSRRRRRASLEDNMTSAYILPDITVGMKQQHPQDTNKAKSTKPSISQDAQNVIQDHDPQHIDDCQICSRLMAKQTAHSSHHVKSKTTTTTHSKRISDTTKPIEGEYTAQVTAMMRDIALEETTMRPKIAPQHALDHLRKLLNDQYRYAKQRHGEAWDEYDRIDAPKQSKRHDRVGEVLGHWARKMEECRVNLDQLRDVEEGMVGV